LIKAVELQLVKYIVKPITAVKLQEALALSIDYLSMKSKNIIKLKQNTSYDTLNKTLLIDNELIKLTKNEQLLLQLLATHPQRAITYQEIENLIWEYNSMSMDAFRSLVRALRKKMQGDFLENVSGIGYRLLTL
jgi:DNA-binding response OmpR family regulator